MELSPNQLILRKSPVMDYPFHMCTKSYPTQIRNKPHPFLVRNVKGFLGLPTQRVETEDDESMASRGTVERYIKDSLKRGDWNFKDKPIGYVKKTKDLDSILALQYFTGLQSYSFKEDYLPYLGYREYFSDWRRQLRNITETAYQPLLGSTTTNEDNTPQPMHPNEWLNGNRPLTRSKSMYSETGRLTTRETRTNTSSSHRIHSHKLSPTNVKSGPNLNELDAVVFMLLSDLLQTQSVHLIQSWLSRSTERERALLVSMLQSALSKSTSEIEAEIPNKSIKTSETRVKTCQNAVQASSNNSSVKPEESNVLVIDTKDTDGSKGEDIRPPTSSTFNHSRVQIETEKKNRLKSRDSKMSMWSQEDSIQN